MTTLGPNAVYAAATNLLGVRFDPYPAFNFLVEIEGLLVGGFSEVQGLECEIEYEEVEEGGYGTHKVPVGSKYPNLVLKHGLTDIDGLWGWFHDVQQNRPGLYNAAKQKIKQALFGDGPKQGAYRRNGTIYLLDGRRFPAAWWDFKEAFPVKWTGPDLQTDRGAIAFESVELAHQGLTKPTASRAFSALRLSAKTAEAAGLQAPGAAGEALGFLA